MTKIQRDIDAITRRCALWRVSFVLSTAARNLPLACREIPDGKYLAGQRWSGSGSLRDHVERVLRQLPDRQRESFVQSILSRHRLDD